jgi:hypothetical protein
LTISKEFKNIGQIATILNYSNTTPIYYREKNLIIDPSRSVEKFPKFVVCIVVESSKSVDRAVAFSHISSRFGGRVQVRVSLMLVHSLSTVEHSQNSPENPSGHEQVKESTPSLHFPPFRHLKYKCSFNRSQSYQTLFFSDFCY